MIKTIILLATCGILAASCRHTPKANTGACPSTPHSGNRAASAETDTQTKTLERFFAQGTRLEAVEGNRSAAYVIFGKDSLQADVYTTKKSSVQTLERRILPTGEPVWNIEDDDTYNLRLENGCWTLSHRGTMRYKQLSEGGIATGQWQEEHFEDSLPTHCPHATFRLAIRHRQYSGDGHFLLSLTPRSAETDSTTCGPTLLTGRRYTLRGTATDTDATVWQLVTDDRDKTYNFVYDAKKETLLFLDENETD